MELNRLSQIKTCTSQRGAALITSLLLLVLITILAMAMFRSFNGEEKMAGNERDKQRALASAQSALVYAEYWLSLPQNQNAPRVPCTAAVSSTGQVQVCTNLIEKPEIIPWQSQGKLVGNVYAPTWMNTSKNGGAEMYFDRPQFYIVYLGLLNIGGLAPVYQIDAMGYGLNGSTVAVVESTYRVDTSTPAGGGNSSDGSGISL